MSLWFSLAANIIWRCPARFDTSDSFGCSTRKRKGKTIYAGQTGSVTTQPYNHWRGVFEDIEWRKVDNSLWHFEGDFQRSRNSLRIAPKCEYMYHHLWIFWCTCLISNSTVMSLELRRTRTIPLNWIILSRAFLPFGHSMLLQSLWHQWPRWSVASPRIWIRNK